MKRKGIMIFCTAIALGMLLTMSGCNEKDKGNDISFIYDIEDENLQPIVDYIATYQNFRSEDNEDIEMFLLSDYDYNGTDFRDMQLHVHGRYELTYDDIMELPKLSVYEERPADMEGDESLRFSVYLLIGDNGGLTIIDYVTHEPLVTLYSEIQKREQEEMARIEAEMEAAVIAEGSMGNIEAEEPVPQDGAEKNEDKQNDTVSEQL